MSLHRFTEAAALLLLGAGLLSGCATVPSTTPAEEAASADARVVPPAVQTQYEQAVAVMAAGDLTDAELRFKEFLLSFPDYPGAHVNLSIIHAANGDDEAARAAVDAALSVDPDYPPALNQLGVLFRKSGNFTESEAAYLKAVTVQPEYALAHYNLGVLNELYLQRYEAALQHFERYRELVGEDKQVDRWITDLTRRIAANQRTANVTE